MGSGFFTTAWRRGTMLLAAPDEPVGCEAHCHFDLSALALPRRLIGRAWAEFGNASRPVDTGALHEQAFSDPLIFELGLKLVDEAAQENPSGTLYADSLAYVISANLLRLAGEIQTPQAEARPLDPLSLGRVIDDMEDRLADRISMTELATLLDMNVYGFSRAFRAATNMSPHQFLTDRRITRVKELLEQTDEPLAAIAVDCGFSNQSHMTAAFRKHEGIPPGAWRRARRG
ncbi:MAG: AraC family transcriptional regulator [Pseudomonadota bacterium]